MIHIAICDDEPCMIELLSQQTAAFFKEKRMDISIHPFSCGRALLEYGGTLDIVFLDIQMAPPDGLQTARQLRQNHFRGFLLFVTAYRDYVFDSFDTEPFDYLIKPLQPESFTRTMERLVGSIHSFGRKQLPIRRGCELELVPFSHILYCEIFNRKVCLHLKDSRILSYYEKIEQLEQKLDQRFFRCHRSYLINLQYLKSFQKETALLANGDRVPVSRLRKERFTAAILEYMTNGRCFDV